MKEGTIQEKTFDDHVKEWEKLSTESDKTSSQADEYYDKHILPDVKEKFTENYRPEQEYDGLVLTVGGSPEPVILSICAIQSNRVGLICAEGRKGSIDRIVNNVDKTSLKASDLLSSGYAVDGSKTIEIYKAIMDLYTKWDKPKKIAIGITGGKKVMSAAAAMAGVMLGADLYYVDTNDKNELNKPVPGSEYLRLLDNPYDVLGELEDANAKELFKNHNYAEAERIFDNLIQKVGDPQKRAVYQIYKYLCTAYNAWDNLNVQFASTELEKLLKDLDRYQIIEELSKLHEFKSRLEDQKGALECLREFVNKPEKEKGVPPELSDRFHFAFTLYYNALGRSEQGKYDLACLLLYRLLEWIGQCRLHEYGIYTDDSNHDYSKCKTEKTEVEILKGYLKKHKEIIPDGAIKSALPAGRITFLDMYLLLSALGDDIVKGLNWGTLMQQIETRNKCIYIHGRRVINQAEYVGFKKTADQLFTKAKELACFSEEDIKCFEKQHEFIDPFK